MRRRTDDDLPGCVAALTTVPAAHGYPTAWPADPAGELRVVNDVLGDLLATEV
ncbi:hypothetical protein ACVGOW_02120 [Pseudonocardia saturnea]